MKCVSAHADDDDSTDFVFTIRSSIKFHALASATVAMFALQGQLTLITLPGKALATGGESPIPVG